MGSHASYAVLQKSELNAIKIKADSKCNTRDTRVYCAALQIGCLVQRTRRQPVKPDDHSELVPLLPIPNRTVKRLSADDSADSRVKVGHRQAINCKALVTA